MTGVNREGRHQVVPPELLKVVTLPFPLVQDGTLSKLIANMLDEPFSVIVLAKTSNASVSVFLDTERAYYVPNPEAVDDLDEPKKQRSYPREPAPCPHCGQIVKGPSGLSAHIRHRHPNQSQTATPLTRVV